MEQRSNSLATFVGKLPTRTLTLPELMLIAGTRVALGVGIGLLLAGRLSPERRRMVGRTLFAIGAGSTVPLAARVLFGQNRVSMSRREEGASRTEGTSRRGKALMSTNS